MLDDVIEYDVKIAFFPRVNWKKWILFSCRQMKYKSVVNLF